MYPSRQEVIATLGSCLPIFHNLYYQVGYQPTEDDLGCLNKLHQLFEAGLLDDEKILEEAGLPYDEAFGLLLGYANEIRSRTGKAPSEED